MKSLAGAVAIAAGTLISSVSLAQQSVPAQSAIAEPATAEPAAAVVRVRIEAQPLEQALQAFSAQTGVQVIFPTELAHERNAPAVDGELTPDEVLRRLLADSGLEFTHVNDRTVTLTARPDQARERSSGLEEVLVTGTHIRGADPLSPVTSVTRAEIVQGGYLQADDVIRSLPQAFKGGAAQDVHAATAVSGAANQSFGSGVNLRGLGTTATLVLLNGHRMAPSSYGDFTDVSMIPISVIDRVDVVTDGASSIYGADAVAGVVNIITRRNYAGSEVSANFASDRSGDKADYGGNILHGFNWAGGNLALSYDYGHQDALRAEDRSFTSSAPSPFYLSPRQDRHSGYAALNQRVGDRISLASSLLYSARNFLSVSQNPLSLSDGNVRRLATTLDIAVDLAPEWSLNLAGTYSRERDYLVYQYPQLAFVGRGRQLSTDYNAELKASGHLFEAPGGTARLALGTAIDRQFFKTGLDTVYPSERTGTSAYAEMLVPLVGAPNARRGVQRLEVSVAGRYDHYSDFGHTANPKYAVLWAPVQGLSLHASYSTSFRAPTLQTLDESYNNFGYIQDLPDGTKLVVLDGANQGLQPEESTTKSIGFDLKPAAIEGFALSASYFDITFDNRIQRLYDLFYYPYLPDAGSLGQYLNLAPTPESLASELGYPGRTIIDFSMNPGPVTAFADLRYQNAAATQTSGVDFDGTYRFKAAGGDWIAGLNATYITQNRTRLTPTTTPHDEIDIVDHPVRLRARADLSWHRGPWSTLVRVNYVPDYENTISPGCSQISPCGVSAWTTLDTNIAYTAPATGLLRDLRVALNIRNLFDRDPPFVLPRYGNGIGYDPANADALGRMLSIVLTKQL